jgi:hypothetical protein
MDLNGTRRETVTIHFRRGVSPPQTCGTSSPPSLYPSVYSPVLLDDWLLMFMMLYECTMTLKNDLKRACLFEYYYTKSS